MFLGVQIFTVHCLCHYINIFWKPYYRYAKTTCATSAQSDQSSLSAWTNLGSLAMHWVHIEDSDGTSDVDQTLYGFVLIGHSGFVCILWFGN